MRQILYAFHFDSSPKNEHETRARFLPRSLEFSKRRNDSFMFFRTALLVPSPETQSFVSWVVAGP
jgi:hypothetical protein